MDSSRPPEDDAAAQGVPAGVYAHSSGVADHDSDLFALKEGDVIRLMAEDGVDCPLWSAGLLFSDEGEFVEFGAPEELARDLASWALARETTGRTEQSDLEALRLLDRLTKAFDHRYTFVYRP